MCIRDRFGCVALGEGIFRDALVGKIVIDVYKRQVIDNETVTNCLQEHMAIYDKDGELHYDIISAFIKSIRGSDPNAAVYYLARMLDVYKRQHQERDRGQEG